MFWINYISVKLEGKNITHQTFTKIDYHQESRNKPMPKFKMLKNYKEKFL